MTHFADKTMKYHTIRFPYNNPAALKAFKLIALKKEKNQTKLVLEALEKHYDLPKFII